MDVITSSGQILPPSLRRDQTRKHREMDYRLVGVRRGPPVMSSPVTNYLSHLEQSLNLSGLRSLSLQLSCWSKFDLQFAVSECLLCVSHGAGSFRYLFLVQCFVHVSVTACVTLN